MANPPSKWPKTAPKWLFADEAKLCLMNLQFLRRSWTAWKDGWKCKRRDLYMLCVGGPRSSNSDHQHHYLYTCLLGKSICFIQRFEKKELLKLKESESLSNGNEATNLWKDILPIPIISTKQWSEGSCPHCVFFPSEKPSGKFYHWNPKGLK